MRRWALIALGAVLALAGAIAGVAYWQARAVVSELQAGPKRAVVTSVQPELGRAPRRRLVTPPPEPHAQTLLLIGSDHRWAGQGGARSDTILLARVQPSRHRIALLSIPRDLYVEIPGHGHDRINEAFHRGGERLLTRVVRETFGVEIDHFVEVDFRGFKGLVDALGGVYLPVDQRYYNRNVGTPGTNYANIDLRPGYQKLDGAQALAFARYRHTDNDFVRAARQQLLLEVAARSALASGWDFFELRRLAIAFAKATTSDISSLGEILDLARAVHGTPPGGVVRLTVPAHDDVIDGADYLRASRSQLRRVVRRWLGAQAPRTHGSPRKKPARPTRPTPVRLVHDPAGRRLLSSVRTGMRVCAPTALPPGYAWPVGAARSYVLHGHPAVAAYATAGVGRSVLWMFTTWRDPPLLARPTGTTRLHGRTYELYSAGGRMREVSWRLGPTRAWITNTLQGTLSRRQLLALADSCR